MPQCLAILAPSGRDSSVICKILKSADVATSVEPGIDSLIDALDEPRAGGVILAEEAVNEESMALLERWIASQPPWSDLPIVLLTRGRTGPDANFGIASRLGNVTILERPLHPVTLVSAARAALRARARQHEAEQYVAELELSEQRLRESESKYRTLFDTMDEGFCIIQFLDGPHGRASDYVHVEANAAYERHAGIADVVGQRLREMVPDEADDWVKRYRTVLDTGKPIRFEQELVATGRHLELAAFRIEPASKRQVAVLFQDITVRRQAEIALHQLNATLEQRISEALAERKLLADLVEGTDAIVQVVDKNFRILAINKAAADETEKLTGNRPKVGDHKLELLADRPDLLSKTREVWQRAIDGEAFTEIAGVDDPRRGLRHYEMKFNPLLGPSGKQVGAYQFAYDVTDRVRDQQRLAEATSQMHEMAKLETLGQLTGGVAHDFNNLLTPIVGALDMLRRQHEADERSNRLISGAMQAAERAATLVQRLLSFARRQHLETRTVDMKSLVEGMHDLMQRTIGPHIAIRVDTAANVPAARVDPGQLELAVLNLAVNARDAMAGGGQIRLTLDEVEISPADENSLAPGNYVRIAVTDTGTGMDEATLHRAIEPFFTTKGQGEGTGLGLSMVHGLAAQSGGALKIKSKIGSGTTAELWFPVAEGRVAAPEVNDGELPTQPRRASILIVDDENLVRSATAEMLREMGHSVIEAATGAAALERLNSREDIDLLITDYLMPGMRGSELAEDAQDIRPGLPVLLLTGYANLAKGEAAGLPRLSKPFREADLARAVAALLTEGKRPSGKPRLRSV
jgi:C4-dicarboxylate-specific signal transduction histidine kinase/DNA-binding response OmpR family regulator